jgi:FKBP-type peptidyl-prolyl cis-trans isomerase
MRGSRRAAVALVAAALCACDKGADAPAAAQGGKPAGPPPPAKYEGPPGERKCEVEVVAKGDGREVKAGDTVLAHCVFTVADTGKTLIDTRQEGDPQPLQVGNGYTVPALDQAIVKMRVGDRWKIKAPYQLAYGEQGAPPMVPPKTDVVLDVEIMGFLELKTEVLRQGSGAPPAPDDYVLLHETGTLPDGRVFEDSRAGDAPTIVTLGVGRMIQGWYLALRQMKVGDRVKVTIPWRFAYGKEGKPPMVPGKTDVVFDLERLPLPEVKIDVLAPGAGPPCLPGQVLAVDYTGTLADGTQISNSRGRGQPYRVKLWSRPPQAIPGWELALLKMRVGERAKLSIPWQLGYGAQGQPPSVPPKADLVFDVEVLEAK